MSDRSGRPEIWKKPLAGGNAVQVTSRGAADLFESLDAKLLYFHKGQQSRGIWSMPVGGGPETQVTPRRRDGNWAVATSGLYFLDWDDAPEAKFGRRTYSCGISPVSVPSQATIRRTWSVVRSSPS